MGEIGVNLQLLLAHDQSFVDIRRFTLPSYAGISTTLAVSWAPTRPKVVRLALQHIARRYSANTIAALLAGVEEVCGPNAVAYKASHATLPAAATNASSDAAEPISGDQQAASAPPADTPSTPGCSESGRCAFLSTPSLYFSLPPEKRKGHVVMDYDKQSFDHDSGFVFYDFNKPEGGSRTMELVLAACATQSPATVDHRSHLRPTAFADIPAHLHGQFDLVVIDPPFIVEDVWRKYAVSAKILLRGGGTSADAADQAEGAVARRGHAICTTVAENLPLMQELFPGARRMKFQPRLVLLLCRSSFKGYCIPPARPRRPRFPGFLAINRRHLRT